MVSTISSTSKTNLHQLQTFNSDDNRNHLHDAIFSPYLDGKTSLKTNPFISNTKDQLHHHGTKKEEDGEIGVFGAEKYFYEGEVEASSEADSNISATKYLHQRDNQISLQTRQYKVHYGTPSVRSESTCNSQSALLHTAMTMRNSTRNKQNKTSQPSKGFLAGLGLKCSCSDKNSVDTSDHVGEIYDVFHGRTTPKKVISVGSDADNSIKINKSHAEHLINNKEYHFPKPEKIISPLNSGLGNHLVKMKLQLEEEEEGEEKPRKSLAVFGSPILKNPKSNKSLSFDKKLIIPSRGSGPARIEEVIGFSSANSGSNYINDAASDASSELFEIESIKGKSNSFLARQASDAAANSGCASPTCYAPSEASIEWSVVTASAAVLSDNEEQMSEVTIRSPMRTPYTHSNGKTKDNKGMQRRRPGAGMLLGCKSHKAVRVAGDAFITYEKPSSSPETRSRRTSISQVPRFPAESRIGNFGASHGHNAYASQLLYK